MALVLSDRLSRRWLPDIGNEFWTSETRFRGKELRLMEFYRGSEA